MSEQKILLVQDAGSPLAALKKALSSSGFAVTTCTSGFDALDELRSEPGDTLILSTVKLPDISGFQLCSLIKSAEQTSTIPVVMVGDTRELNDGFWQRAALSDLVIARSDAEKDGPKVVDQIKKLLSEAKGIRSRTITDTSLLPADLDGKDAVSSYQKLLSTLLMERTVAHLARSLVEAVGSRVQFMERFSTYMQKLFQADVTGLIVVDPKSNWAIYDALVPVSKAALEKLQAAANKELDLDGEVRTIVNGETTGKNTVKTHEVIRVTDGHNELIGAVVLGWSSKPELSSEMRTEFEMLTVHLRPVLKALFDLQQIQMLKQHHAFGSYVDPITGLYNIEFLIGFLQQQLLFSSRQKLPTGLILVDVDHFARINEEFGAETGDTVLMSIGHKLSRTIRQSDLLARYSGDTFAIVLPNTDLPGSKIVAEKLRTEIEKMSWDTVGNKLLKVTVCVGCSSFGFEDCNPETILRDAKIALMAAKEVGRNRVSP